MNNKKLKEISKTRSAESLMKEQLHKENEKHARLICGCDNAKKNGSCFKDTIGCYKCELHDNYIADMAMANWKDKQIKIAIEKAKANAQLEILNWMKEEVATYYVKEQVMRKIRYIKKKLKKLNEQ